MMPANMAENGPTVPLGEPPDAQPLGFADACDQFVGHVRRAFMDGASTIEMQLLGATFKSIAMLQQQAQAAMGGGPPGAPVEAGPAGPPSETEDYGAGAGEPTEDEYRQ